MQVMTGKHNEGISRPKYFRLNQLEEETDFATNEELDNCKRFKLIQLRDQAVSNRSLSISLIISESWLLKEVIVCIGHSLKTH